MTGPTLFYVADPMCSWCWGFVPALQRVRASLAPGVTFQRVLGGLARDSAEPMPQETRSYVQAAWDEVERATGARFNRDFWEQCEPRRSTWPACRAVLAGDAQSPAAGDAMFAAVQRAYYLQARNPSDRDVLVTLAEEQGLDVAAFDAELDSPSNQERLEADFALRDRLGVTGFPSLVVERGRGEHLGGLLRVLARGHVAPDELMELMRREKLVN